MGQLAESRIYGIMELRRASLVLRQTTRLLVNKTTSGASQGFVDNGQQNLGFASASPDNETTSQQDNKTTSGASQGFARRLRRLVVCEATAEHNAAASVVCYLRIYSFTTRYYLLQHRQSFCVLFAAYWEVQFSPH